ncbi:2-hydroxyacid dehydrogenase [Peribacillus sp. SCS-155]|uniref:2-hydroxyacid dehydrogenase n=1 Tax=Peribacillus sedimenti TaxID=3115297 RepID=UPI003906D42C
MDNPYVFITRKLPAQIVKKLETNFRVKMWESEDEPIPREVLMQEAKEAAGLLTMLSEKIDAAVMDEAKNLRVIANLAVGFDNIDIDAATNRDIFVCNTPDVLTETTADLTFALMMAAARRIVEAADIVKNGEWKSWSPLLLAGHDIHHKKIGIVGMGKIGTSVAKRAKGFDMEILYHNRSRNPMAEELYGARYCSFEELISTSDFIVCLAPLTPETTKMFNKQSFMKMKTTAVFVNASRGPVVDEAALHNALISGEIAAAGLDVFEQEPIDAGHPLLSLKNVVALPHIASSSIDTRTAMMNLCIENIELVLHNNAPKTLVNKQLAK